MRYLAVARYRLLTTIRSASWLFAVSFAAAAAPVAGKSGLFNWDVIASDGWNVASAVSEVEFRWLAGTMLADAAIAVLIAFALHTLILLVACDAFATARSAGIHDLMDTAPIAPGVRFLGEALGVFGAAMTVHVATLPLLMLAGVLSALPTAWIVAAEATVVAICALASAGAAWKLRAAPSRWHRTRSARSTVTFLILLSIPAGLATRWEAFRDAVATFVQFPSPGSWAAVAAAVDHPVLLFVLLLLLYAGFMVFYYASSVRSHSPRRTADALQPLWT